MEVGIELDSKSLGEVLSKFEFAEFAASKYFGEALQESTLYTEANVEIRTPTGYSGYLKASISSQLLTELVGSMVGIVSTPAIYAPAAEKGSRPHFPPIEALTGKLESLDLWARQKGLNAFAVAKGIARKGTKGKHMFAEGMEASRAGVYSIFLAKAQEYLNSLKG